MASRDFLISSTGSFGMPDHRWWRKCSGCGMDRRLASLKNPELMVRHHRWDAGLYEMVPCEGSGKPPSGPVEVKFSGVAS